MTRFIDVHLLQQVPPSNLNRDDSGAPKSARFGGTRRARVSSQAWKRATRLEMARQLEGVDSAVRTLRFGRALTAPLMALEYTQSDAHYLASAALECLGISGGVEKVPNEKGELEESDLVTSSYLMLLSHRQLEELAVVIAQDSQKALGAGDPVAAAKALDKKGMLSALGSHHSLDLGLFGRMVADNADLSVSAAAQVAHALSVHPVETEFDYFTAVDDLNTTAETGAGMIGTVEFNSALLYRYANLNVDLLESTLGEQRLAALGTTGFIRAFITSMPTGHETSFAHRTRPGYIELTLRTDQPVNLVGAFESSVDPSAGMMREAIARLQGFVEDESAVYGNPGRSWRVAAPSLASELGFPALSLDTALEGITAALREG